MSKYGFIFSLKKRQLLFHVFYWILNVLFFTLIFSSRNSFNDFGQQLLVNLIYLPGGILFTYFSIYYLLPKYFFTGRITLFVILQSIVILLYPVFSSTVRVFIVENFILHVSQVTSLTSLLSTILILIFDMFPIAGYMVARQLIKDSILRKRIENEKLEAEVKLRDAELKILRGQLQPHFLFNTLNNLYSLSLEKSDKTPEMIIRLSDLLSYITYDCNADKVSFEKEIVFLQSYIELEKLRYDTHLIINLSIIGDFNHKYIAPMILHTFVENSFKHGASKDAENPRIDINLTIKDNWINFNVFNSKIAEEDKSGVGIGIENAKRRLELIYPNRHSLTIVSNRSTYSVFLEIEL